MLDICAMLWYTLWVIDLNLLGSWIYHNQPVTVSQLVTYSKTSDRKAKSLLLFLTYRIPIYEDNSGKLGIDPSLTGFKNFHLLEPKEL